jgi:hypothetical protein
MTPDWTSSPQHVIAGIVLALLTYALARGRGRLSWIVSAGLALVVTMAAEAMVELVEYPLLYGDDASARAYYDTIADIGATLVGAVLGAAVGAVWSLARRHPRA